MRRIVATYRAAYSGLPQDVWSLSLVMLVNRAGTMVLPFLTLWLTTTRNLAADTAGLFVSAWGCGAVLGSWLGGALSDSMGAGRVQAASLACAGALFLVLGRLESTAAIVAILFCIGVLGDAARPANAALLAALAPPGRRMQAFALNRLAINVGSALGPAVGGILAVVDYELLFVVDGVTCLLAAGLAARLFGRATSTVDAAARGAQSSRAGPRHDRVFVGCLVLTFATFCVFLQALSTMPLYLRDAYGLREDAIGLLFAINPVLIVALEMILVHRLNRPNPLRIVGLSALLTGLGFALLPYGQGCGFVALTVVIWTVGEMLDAPLMGGFIADRAPDSHRGRYMGWYAMTFSIGFVVAPTVGAWVYRRLGPDVLWLACGILGAAVAVAFQLLARRVDVERAARAVAAGPDEPTA